MHQLQPHYDLVIVGSGGGSMCAALVAKKLGKSVVILEKQAFVGGSTGYSGGVLWIPDNPLLARAGVLDSPEDARRYFDAVVPDEGPATSSARRDAFLRTGPSMVDFLERHGMAFYWADGWSDYYDERPGGAPRGRSLMAEPFDSNELGEWRDRLSVYPPFRNLPLPANKAPTLSLFKRTWAGKKALASFVGSVLKAKLLGRRMVANGGAVQGRMLQIALREGIPVFPETAVEDLIVEDGRVVGVRARREGREIDVRGTNVLLNTGGFARNEPMRKQFQRAPLSITNATEGDTGELLLSAMKVGAATANLDAAVWVLTSRGTNGSWPKESVAKDGRIYPPIHNFDLAKPFGFIVDGTGERYMNEASSYVEQGETMYARHAKNGCAIPSWFVMDSRLIRYYGLGTNAPGHLPDQWLESGYLKRSDTIAGLARECNIDPVGLQRTVERFNRFSASGVDEDFRRGARQYDRWRGDPRVAPNPCLGPVEKGPFHAVAIYPGDVGTAGGLLTDEHARVLREDGTPISGLYATGNCTASVVGHTYPAAGASIAASFVFGYIAAHHAAGAPLATAG